MSKKLLTTLSLFACSFAFVLSASAVVGPEPTGTILINNGATYVNSRNVTLNLSTTDGSIVRMEFSNGGSYSTPEPYATATSWTLSAGADGLRNVRVKFINTSGATTSTGILATTTLDTTAPVITAPVDQTFEATGATTTPTLTSATSTDVTSSTTVDYSPKEFSVGTTTVTWTATDAAGNFATTSSLVIITEKVVTVPPVVTPSHRGGSSIMKVNFALATSTGQVLGTSTEKAVKEKVIKRKLTPEEKKARVFKKRLNHIKIAIYELKHPESKVPPIEIVFGTSTQSSSVGTVPLVPTNLTVSDSGEIVGTGTKATTTPKKKPFWKLW
ncbi:MAG: HYR domain-containing protein [Candidatus Paceibacterota bacterium]|jgi:hypothetical protein